MTPPFRGKLYATTVVVDSHLIGGWFHSWMLIWVDMNCVYGEIEDLDRFSFNSLGKINT